MLNAFLSTFVKLEDDDSVNDDKASIDEENTKANKE